MGDDSESGVDNNLPSDFSTLDVISYVHEVCWILEVKTAKKESASPEL